MFQYEFEKRGAMTSAGPSSRRVEPSVERARRPLPPRPIHNVMPPKSQVPLKVWIVASASCFAVCGALVLATVAITRWGAADHYSYSPQPEPIYAKRPQIQTEQPSLQDIDNDIANSAILSKLQLFKNTDRDKSRDLLAKPQPHPVHDATHHAQRKIEKKDKPKPPEHINELNVEAPAREPHHNILEHSPDRNNDGDSVVDANGFQPLPHFKPMKPAQMKVPASYINNINKEYEEYYNDEILYDDYMQSNSMTSYLIEKVQELHEWIATDAEFDRNATTGDTTADLSRVLHALNESVAEGDVSVVLHALRDLYFGDNFTSAGRRAVLANSTDLLTFGILSLDVMLLHNIQMMAWENQESARTKMLADSDVFAFSALFMDPGEVEARQAEIQHIAAPKRQNVGVNVRQETEEFDIGKSLFENIVEVGMSAARAAIHLGRAYKNARSIVSQMSAPPPSLKSDLQTQMSRHLDEHTHALLHLQSSWTERSPASVSELDCVWLLYCRNLVATAKLNPPFGTMAKINGMALRLLAGGVPAGRELDSMLYEALTGWTPLDCDHMLPKCSTSDAAAVVLASILQSNKKTTNKGR